MGKGTKKRVKHRASSIEKKDLSTLIKKNPDVLEVLDKHGVTFCAGCYLTLTSPVERAAAYHAVPDLARFLKDLKRAIDAA